MGKGIKLQIEGRYFKDLSRKDYISKANEIIRAEGVKALSIRRLANELNCSSASLYHYFENMDELLYYAQIGFLDFYLEGISRYEKRWRDVWDVHIGIWDCYTKAAFTYPEAFDMIFLSPLSAKLPVALREYYGMFPESLNLVSPYLHRMLETPDFKERDYLMCAMCAESGVISRKNARRLNEITCSLYRGYLKEILDYGIRKEEIEARKDAFLSHLRMLIAFLAEDTLGHAELNKKKYFA